MIINSEGDWYVIDFYLKEFFRMCWPVADETLAKIWKVAKTCSEVCLEHLNDSSDNKKHIYFAKFWLNRIYTCEKCEKLWVP